MKKCFFIAATGAGIGKTFITTCLIKQAKALGNTVIAYKPIITGFDVDRLDSTDTGRILNTLDRRVTPEVIKNISPWPYASPLAPSIAARKEGRPIDFQMLASWSQRIAKGIDDIILIEGIVGVMTPITDTHTVRDWIQATNIPVLLIAGNYSGTLSHTLTALTALKSGQVNVPAVIINDFDHSATSEDAIDLRAEELTRLTKIPVIKVKYHTPNDGWDMKELRALLT